MYGSAAAGESAATAGGSAVDDIILVVAPPRAARADAGEERVAADEARVVDDGAHANARPALSRSIPVTSASAMLIAGKSRAFVGLPRQQRVQPLRVSVGVTVTIAAPGETVYDQKARHNPKVRPIQEDFRNCRGQLRHQRIT